MRGSQPTTASEGAIREAGVTVDDKTADEFNGRFGWASDPEGNRFELWELK